MTSTQQPGQFLQQLQSADPVEVYNALRAIKNAIIGSSSKKSMYCRLQIIPQVSTLLAMEDTDVQIRIQATTIVSSLAHKSEEVAQQLSESGVMDALIAQLMPGTDVVLIETSERALNALLSYVSTRISVEKHTTTMVPYLLSIITEARESPRIFEMRMHARVELAVLLLEKLCVTEARQFIVANTGVMDMLVPLLQRSYPRLQMATLRAFAALSYENMEISRALATVMHGEQTFVQIVAELARSQAAEIRLHACLCLSNLSRMRAVSDSRIIQGVAVPALTRLLRNAEVERLQVIEALGYMCHEDAEIQMAAKNAGAISDLLAILADIESQADADFVDHSHNVKVAKATLLTLGTIVSAGEECRLAAVEGHVLAYLVRAMGHSNDGVKAAACLCTQYIVRSVPICRTNVPESGLLKPLLSLVRGSAIEVQIKATAALINLLPDFSPLRTEALKEGVIDALVKLLDSDHVMIRRNALWCMRNLLVKPDDDIRRQIVDRVGIERLRALALPDKEVMIREQASGLLQNITADNDMGTRVLFEHLGADKVLELLYEFLACTETPVNVHALYLANNIAIRSPDYCKHIVDNKDVFLKIVDHIRSTNSEVAIGALWCISSIASHKNDGQDSMRFSHEMYDRYGLNVPQILESLLEDRGLCLSVRDRIKSCLDYFDPDIKT
ncbi:hypothetical protein LPJ55_001451 [Coemansia sp. RSA 990]|nr:hypothetical protein LPJ55_001451 [Coemansia sp. RSA 990]